MALPPLILEFNTTTMITNKAAVKLCATANTKGKCNTKLLMPNAICVIKATNNKTLQRFNCQYFKVVKPSAPK